LALTDRTQKAVLQHRQQTTDLRCETSQKSEDLIYIAAEA